MTSTDTAARDLAVRQERERTYAAVIRQLHCVADLLTRELGAEVRFGYIGNCDLPRYDDRSWCLFLPHPGRVGTSGDCIGGFITDDLDGAVRALDAARGALTMARYLKGRVA